MKLLKRGRHPIVLGLVVVLIAAALAACGGGGGSSEPAAKGDAVAGEQQFNMQGCTACHSLGTDTLVGPGMATVYAKDTMRDGRPLTDANIGDWIKNGGTGDLGAMPAHPHLTEKQIDDLIAFIKTKS